MMDSVFWSRYRHILAEKEMNRLIRVIPEMGALLRIARNAKRSGTITKMAERESLERQIKRYASGGKVALYVWQRDCDCAEWDEMSIIDADVKTIQARVDSIYDSAEGPVTWGIRPPSAIKSFRSSHRDRVMEAYENGGNTYSV